MGRQIKVDLERTIPAPPARVHAALADYRGRGDGGLFERIHGELLDNLTRRLGATPPS